MSERWVNAVIEATIPFDSEKQAQAYLLSDEFGRHANAVLDLLSEHGVVLSARTEWAWSSEGDA